MSLNLGSNYTWSRAMMTRKRRALRRAPKRSPIQAVSDVRLALARAPKIKLTPRIVAAGRYAAIGSRA